MGNIISPTTFEARCSGLEQTVLLAIKRYIFVILAKHATLALNIVRQTGC